MIRLYPIRRWAGRIRRRSAVTAAVVVLAASYAYVFPALIEVPGGSWFREWPLYVFCFSTLVVAAAGAIADNRRRCRRSEALPGLAATETDSPPPADTVPVEARPARWASLA